MNLHVANTPWECDDIVFLPGDWDITRASEEGLYQYTISGIASRNLATAADLVKWKMAKFLSLDLLLPWDNDGITFVSGVDILRDFKNSSKKEKYYLLHDGSSATELLRVNKYYLIKEKYAVASDELKQAIAQKKVKSKKYNRSCEPWPEDDIFILDAQGDETIARGATPGLYRVRAGATSKNWRADVLVAEHKALTGYDVRLDESSSCENASLQEYFDATYGFWLTAATAPSFAEIAHIWCSLQYNPDSAIASALLAELNQAVESIATFTERFADFDDKANDIDDAIKKIQPKVIELENIYNACKVFQNQTILDDFSCFPEILADFIAAKNEIDAAYEDISKSLNELNGILSSIKQDVAKIKGVRFFPHDVLPREFVVYIQAKEDDYTSMLGALQDFSPYDLRLSDLYATFELIKSVTEPMDIASVESHVGRMITRKTTLDSLRAIIHRDEKFNKKPGLFAKPSKEDGIRYTTGIPIKNKSAGIYTVTYSTGSIDASVIELIYLGLAERI